ncbi:MAG: Dabb family protein [Parafilimonas sp.]|nr:Dabb family protein [Parafilimonas sp.]
MRKIIFSLLLLVIFICAFQVKLKAQTEGSPVLRHIVIITFKQDASADSIQALDNIYRDLSKSPLVKSFEMGVNISTRDTGVIKHVYVTSFASKEDMDNYRKIPEYSKLFKVSLPVSVDVTVADYWAKQ